MSDLNNVETVIPVKDVMTAQVITVQKEDTIMFAAEVMSKCNIGSIIVADKERNPVGVITGMDALRRVVAKNLLSSKVKAEDIMTAPIITISPEADIIEAAKIMNEHDIRRLIVIDGDKLVGIISSKDIIAITPSLTEIIIEKVRISQKPSIPEGFVSIGYCNDCEEWSDSLMEVDSKFLCEECRMNLR